MTPIDANSFVGCVFGFCGKFPVEIIFVNGISRAACYDDCIAYRLVFVKFFDMQLILMLLWVCFIILRYVGILRYIVSLTM